MMITRVMKYFLAGSGVIEYFSQKLDCVRIFDWLDIFSIDIMMSIDRHHDVDRDRQHDVDR